MAAGSSYADRAPVPALAGLASSVWVQRVGDEPIAQRYVPHGGAEVRCVLGEAPRLLGPLTAAVHRELPAGATVVGVRLRPGVVGSLAGVPAGELADRDVDGDDLWRDLDRLTDRLGGARSPATALVELQRFVARSVTAVDPLVGEAARRLMPWRVGTAELPELLSVSARHLPPEGHLDIGRLQRDTGFVPEYDVGRSIADYAAWLATHEA